MKKFKLVDLLYCSMFSGIICICSMISIPLIVPFTLQTLGIFLTLEVLGKKGIISIVIYLLLGLIGIPVFSNFGSGMGAILGPTGGYLVGFIFMWFIYMIFRKKELFSLILSLIVLYVFGTIWFMIFMSNYNVIKVLLICVIPFIIPDLFKLFISLIIKKRILSFYSKAD